ncbi:Pentatricopeptide repeat-containing protein [Monoraphidium neglectum]|uniref:Mitochondrial ribonuclease P catalytic subunit n=1 Tax=Monoraphidium neglectum TaxID=145388 RepID=A0A0D2JUG8_9CHLO|nr:Pentatricopeptide repeat-containing protein [Monoraphidium neglectum]KIZ02508.1 Pentatricopeptide repeat-containing protein [Monoraphidium neglectum]|eukprot:XP_013901527.1 Pentatricopeptide repeat-containing protein [Monoraphidium neglectum]
MQAAGQAPDETIFTHLARAAAARGDPDAALSFAREVVAAERGGGGGGGGKMVARLRTFQPALVGLALAGRADEALAVADELAALGRDYLDLTESEYALLLEAVARGGSYAQFAALLGRMQADLNQLRPSTLALVERFFATPGAAAAFAEGGPMAGRGVGWEAARWVAVDRSGFSADAGEPLGCIDLSPAGWQSLLGTIFDAMGAARHGTEQARRDFEAWLSCHGPYEAIIDGANAALFGRHDPPHTLDLGQVRAVWDAVQLRFPDLRPLVVLSSGKRREVAARDPSDADAAWLLRLQRERRLYVTPRDCHDDWFWLYAAVRAGEKGVLVTNDELRDHIYALLRPKHFFRWKERHIARFTLPQRPAAAPGRAGAAAAAWLHLPSPFTPCVQQLPGSGAWMVPAADRDDWLLIRPRAG